MNEDKLVIARYAAKVLSTKDLIEFAQRKLDERIYSDHLLNIIDEDPRTWDFVSPHFEAFVKENDKEIPSFHDAIIQILKYHITLISKGNINPLDQFRILLQDIKHFDLVANVSEYVGDEIGIHNLYGLYYAVDDLEYKNKEAGLEEIRKLMIEESHKWLDNY